MKRLLLLGLCFLTAQMAVAQAPNINNLYDIALNGEAVTVDGDLADWQDAQWIYLSQDSPHFTEIQGLPDSPADFSAFFAIKMDADNAYFAISVSDEGVPMIETQAEPNLAFNYDHLSVYLGLYDIGANATSSPHQTIDGVEFINAETEDTVAANRTYRIAPEYDNTGTTLGPDYQMLVRALDYEGLGIDPQTYNGAYIDTTIQGTEVATAFYEDETGYILEWKVPFSSLAGQVAKPTGPFANFEWPLFEPTHGEIIVFDADVTDDDGEGGLNTYMRAGDQPSLWRDSKGFGMRGRIVDLAQAENDVPRTNYYINYRSELEVVVDGEIDDWQNAAFFGMGPHSPLFTEIQGVPSSPNDFSGYVGYQMDDENLYVLTRVRDGGNAMIETQDEPNLAFNYDHLSFYLGAYDIGNAAGSPHVEGLDDGLEFYDPVTEDTIAATRTYRIAPDVDNVESTLGADYQMLVRALDYAGIGIDPQTYNGAYVDTTIQGTEVATAFIDEEGGYTLEWKIPFTSLAGNIAKPSREFSNFEWPMFSPEDGQVVVWDADITDRDDDTGALNTYLRAGNLPALWRDSKSFMMRGKVTLTTDNPVSNEDEIIEQLGELPTSIALKQNYPNPFNPTTNIEFALQSRNDVRISVYNMLGQEIAVLVDGTLSAGTHTVSFNATSLSSGIYFYTLQSGAETITRKMTLIK